MNAPSSSAAAASSTSTPTLWQRFVALLKLMFLGPPKKPAAPTKKKLTPEEHAAQTEKLTQALAPWFAQHGVDRFVPTVDDEAHDGDSWFGGGALLPPKSPWPSCARCKQPMHHFLQLDLATLPAGVTPLRDGLLAIFYCSSDDGDCPVWEPFSGCHSFIHSLSTTDCEPRAPPTKGHLKCRAITGWLPGRDPPPAHNGIRFAGDSGRGDVLDDAGNVVVSDVDEHVFYDVCAPSAGDKLGGAPYELQGSHDVPCPVCGAAMKQVFQIDSNDNLDYMFGDTGCAHIVQCEAHPEQLAFWWDCC